MTTLYLASPRVGCILEQGRNNNLGFECTQILFLLLLRAIKLSPSNKRSLNYPAMSAILPLLLKHEKASLPEQLNFTTPDSHVIRAKQDDDVKKAKLNTIVSSFFPGCWWARPLRTRGSRKWRRAAQSTSATPTRPDPAKWSPSTRKVSVNAENAVGKCCTFSIFSRKCTSWKFKRNSIYGTPLDVKQTWWMVEA